MAKDSRSEAEGVGDPVSKDRPFILCTRVREVREELGKRIQRTSVKSAPTIADRLQLAYYQHVLKFYEALPPDKPVRAGYPMWKYASDHKAEVREIHQILSFLIDTKTKGGTPPAWSIYHALPRWARPTNRGRPGARRRSAVRALQFQIDTGQSWTSVTQEICDCPQNKHDQSCKEAIRQSVNGLKRLLRRLGIEIPKVATKGRSKSTLICLLPVRNPTPFVTLLCPLTS